MAKAVAAPAEQADGFDADVLADVAVEPTSEDTILNVSLQITAKNRLDAPVAFCRPYTLATEYAQDLKAFDAVDKLPISYHDGRPSIVFKGRDPIPAGGTYTWTIQFTRRVNARLEADVLILRYILVTQDEFQGSVVHSHSFLCNFRFVKPSTDRWRIWKEYRVKLRDNRKLVKRISQERDATVCRVAEFRVGAKEAAAVLHFICTYGFARRWAHALTSIISILVTVLLEWLLQRVIA